jgi:hypothetical protein
VDVLKLQVFGALGFPQLLHILNILALALALALALVFHCVAACAARPTAAEIAGICFIFAEC